MTAGPGATRPHPAAPASPAPPGPLAPGDSRDPFDPFAGFVDELNAGLRRSALRLRARTQAPAAPAPRETVPRPVDEAAFTPALGLLHLGAKRLSAPAVPRRATGHRAA
ncbi:hypothetical protein AB0E83_32935 [Streptomyces sp. NPDC035033]|uniref:hypothetical protein n=1 Tax=Streptomyces sp. NPDC035033 TaxID=3155368 RepID=UPI0033CAA511